MIEKIIEISSDNIFLSTDRGFLEIFKGKDLLRKIPFSDISTLMFTGFSQNISMNSVNRLLENKVMIILCKNGYTPSSFIWPYDSNFDHHNRIHLQISASLPFKKNVWKEIVRSKIFNQGMVLKSLQNDDNGLILFSQNVKSGDSDGYESQAAKRYWGLIFDSDFYRSDSSNRINSVLNYGYAILRSTVARAICSSGLYPAFGVFHHNSENPFCLVDDFIEPYRPVIDQVVYKIANERNLEDGINSEIKNILATSMNGTVLHAGKRESISRSILKLVESYVRSLEKGIVELSFPDNILLKNNE